MKGGGGLRIGFTAFVAMLAFSAGCGGNGGSTTTSVSVNPGEVKAALRTITNKCIDVSFGVQGNSADSQISLAVDDLIRNFKADPDANIGLGGFKGNSPRDAIEGALTFLEDGDCSPEDAQRIHETLRPGPQLRRAPQGSDSTTPTPDGDVEQQVRETLAAFNERIAASDYEGACEFLTDLQRSGQTFNGRCTMKYAGVRWLPQARITGVVRDRDTTVVQTTGGNVILKQEGGTWRIDSIREHL